MFLQCAQMKTALAVASGSGAFVSDLREIMKKLLLITVLALSASASAQTSKPSAVHSSTTQKPRVFVSAMTRPGAHVTGSLEYQYRFDRALEKEVAKKYALVPYDTKPALLQTLMKSENYYWGGGQYR